MDVVYICRAGDNEELRYSIRSVVKNLPHDNIWVVGQKPKWYTGNFIEIPDKRIKYVNARNNMKAICSSNKISEDFILMNDDFFIMKKVDSLDYFYGGTLEDKAVRFESFSMLGSYTRMLYSTLEKLKDIGIKTPLDYELHVPMIFNKKKLRDALKIKSDLWRSVYGNLYSVGGTQIGDVKTYSGNNKKKQSFDWRKDSKNFLSTEDNSFKEVRDKLLNKHFAKPSSYESSSLS
jgi:hypothetical protein